jgi:hypothetical protein
LLSILQVCAAVALCLPCLSITWGSWLVAAAGRVSPWMERGAVTALALLGVAPILLFVWIALILRTERERRERGECVRCAYPLADVVTSECPECGEPFRPRTMVPAQATEDFVARPGNT